MHTSKLSMEQLRREVAALRREAREDHLTGLRNRRGFDLDRGKNGAFIVVDLDGFKAAQDASPLGHAFGDYVLKAFAGFLVRTTRTTDMVTCRSGGDEFVIWGQNTAAIERVTEAIRKWNCRGVTASAGVGATMVSADSEMYRSKPRR